MQNLFVEMQKSRADPHQHMASEISQSIYNPD